MDCWCWLVRRTFWNLGRGSGWTQPRLDCTIEKRRMAARACRHSIDSLHRLIHYFGLVESEEPPLTFILLTMVWPGAAARAISSACCLSDADATDPASWS